MNGAISIQYVIKGVVMGQLKLIKASAGSGKTYTLTNEYLELLSKKETMFLDTTIKLLVVTGNI